MTHKWIPGSTLISSLLCELMLQFTGETVITRNTELSLQHVACAHTILNPELSIPIGPPYVIKRIVACQCMSMHILPNSCKITITTRSYTADTWVAIR